MEKFRLRDRMKIPTYDKKKHMQMGELNFDPEKCTQCGICISICPGGCILTEKVTKTYLVEKRVTGGKYGIPFLDTVKPDVTLCVACFDCGTACPQGAISIKKNFNPKYFFKRLTQLSEMRYPKPY